MGGRFFDGRPRRLVPSEGDSKTEMAPSPRGPTRRLASSERVDTSDIEESGRGPTSSSLPGSVSIGLVFGLPRFFPEYAFGVAVMSATFGL